MLTQDIQKLKQTLQSTRRSRKFQSQFAPLLLSTPSSSQTQTLLQSFPIKFPYLTQLKQSLPINHSYWSMNQQTQNMTLGTGSQKEDQEEDLNRDDEEFWRKHYGEVKDMPVLDSDREIRRLIQVFRVLEGNDQQARQITRRRRNNSRSSQKIDSQPDKPNKKYKLLANFQPQTIFDTMFEIYHEKGGDKNYEEFKQKIQGDVLTLVHRQVRKKKFLLQRQ